MYQNDTYEDDAPVAREKTWTVPLSLQQHKSFSSGRKATPKISALSLPRRSSRTRRPVCASQTRTSVPRDDVVAISRPEGRTVRVVSAVVCAAMIDAGCLTGFGGGRGGDAGAFGVGAGGRQGGR